MKAKIVKIKLYVKEGGGATTIKPNKKKGENGICHYRNCREQAKNIYCKYHQL